MFSFNFLQNKDDESLNLDEECTPAIEVKPDFDRKTQISSLSAGCTYNFGPSLDVYYLSNESLKSSLDETGDLDIKSAEESHSDLISGVYEGGLKIWECTFDLGSFITKNYCDKLQNKTVLDLGCGAGILGILASKLGAELVDFQDYNAGVIKHLTIPNVFLNFSMFPNVRFWYGEWGGFNQPKCYDVILTSETIYNTKNYSKLHQLFKKCLKSDGIILLAAKSYYFGVGGSISEFLSLVERKGVFKYNSIWSSNEGVKREVIELKFSLL